METSLSITFLRHGRSRADDENVIEGRYDSPLTAVGQGQARERAAGWLREGLHFDLVICSTLQRARATAEIVAGCLGAPLEFDPDWMEMDNGPLAGLAREEAERLYPRPASRGPFDPLANSGESETQLHCRAARAVEQVVRRGPGSYLVVAHGGILNAALRFAAGAPLRINYQGIWFDFGDLGYASFRYLPARYQWQLLEFHP
jgi:2,3-bisphosphoglycerate-dependent phosphoglycerate mutase